MHIPLTATREGASALRVTREFSASRVLVWRSFTDPHILQRWLLGPPGWTMHKCRVDARPGGTYAWGWRNPATGEGFGCSGTYSEVRVGRRMVDTQTVHLGDPSRPIFGTTVNAMSFGEAPGGTRVTTRIVYPDAASREAILAQDMTAAMEASYVRLDATLAELLEASAVA